VQRAILGDPAKHASVIPADVDFAAAARDTVQEHPIATLAIVAGLAFAVGALWKVGQSRQQTPVDALLSRLGELQNQLPRRWRM
jgi:hypothetical protein